MVHNAIALALFLALSAPLAAQIDVGSDGSDGAFVAQGNVEIDLATQGTYDPVHWRVVFNYQSVHVQPGAVVTFKNHPSRAPVVWLSQGDIVIEGEVALDGEDGVILPLMAFDAADPPFTAQPGPGGFRGGGMDYLNSWGKEATAGLGPISGGGYGPGGSQRNSALDGDSGGAGHGSVGQSIPGSTPGGLVYGSVDLWTLRGGSGGAASGPQFTYGNGAESYSDRNGGGGAGGGAILLAANDEVHLKGNGCWLHANGGGLISVPGAGNYITTACGGGSGGAIRLLADEITIDTTATLEALGGHVTALFGGSTGTDGASGRIRLESNLPDVQGVVTPAPDSATPGPVLPPASAPTIRIQKVAGLLVGADPQAAFGDDPLPPDSVLDTPSVQVEIRTENLPVSTPTFLRTTGAVGAAPTISVTDGIAVSLTPTGGPNQEASATIDLDLMEGWTVLQAIAGSAYECASREVSVEVTSEDLEVPAFSVPNNMQSASYLQLGVEVHNTGGGEATAHNYSSFQVRNGFWTDEVGLSTDQVLGNADDIVLHTATRSAGLASGDSYSLLDEFWIPPSLTGTYWVYARTDFKDWHTLLTWQTPGIGLVVESNETNNVTFSSVPITITPPVLPVVTLPGGSYVGPSDTSLDGAFVIVESGTVTVDGSHNIGRLTVRPGGMLTHSSGFLGGLELLVSGDVLIESGASIDVTGKGYAPTEGPGAGVSIVLPPPTSFSKYGGGHGGFGGSNTPDLSTFGHDYGTLLEPRTLGSGGLDVQGFGGGAIALQVGGTLTLDGNVLASGLPTQVSGGGGAGGSVWITAGNLVGAGAVAAQGGTGAPTLGFLSAGGGGGGRIHVASQDASGFSGPVTAYGGQGQTHGGAGTIVIEDKSTNGLDLIIRNFQQGLVFQDDPLPWSPTVFCSNLEFDSILIDDGVRLQAGHASYGLRMCASGDVTIGRGAGLWAEGLGFGDAAGPGSSLSPLVGGSHGGHGGIGFNQAGNVLGPTYGDRFAPLSPGSGRPGGAGVGPHGGGSVALEVGGALVFNGYANACGEDGGGSGGSVLFIADTISGNGAVEARGGDSGFGQICGVQQGAGGGGRIALQARSVGGLVGFTGFLDANGGIQLLGCVGSQASESGTVETEEDNIPPLLVPLCPPLIDGTEDFDALASLVGGGAPDLDVPAGAWGYPPTYGIYAQGEVGGVGVQLVDTSTFDPVKSGVSLALDENLSSPTLFATGLWECAISATGGKSLRVEGSVWVASGVGGGGVLSVGYGNGTTPDPNGPNALAPIPDMGPALEWLSDGRLVAHLAGWNTTQDVTDASMSFDRWQRVRMDIDIDQSVYDVWWAELGQPLQLVATDLPFVTPQSRLDRFVIGQQAAARAFYDDFAINIVPPGQAPPLVYCTATASSSSCLASISASNVLVQPTSGDNDYSVTATEVEAFKPGLLFVGVAGPAAIPFLGGTLCVSPPTKRGPVLFSAGTMGDPCSGSFAQLVNDGVTIPLGLDAGPGNSSWNQFWFRDPTNPSGFGTALSNAIQLDFQ